MRPLPMLHAAFLLCLATLAAPASHSQSASTSSPSSRPGCEADTPRACLGRAIDAMGGRDRLASVKTVRLDVIAHTELVEQSYRQAPFITSYQRSQVTIDHAGGRLMKVTHAVWPESDLKQADSDSTLIVTSAGGVNRNNGKDTPCGGAALDSAHRTLALAPEVLLLGAAAAPDLHFLPAEEVRSTTHAVLGFKSNGVPVRILLNRFNHLPDAVETTQEFRDFWFYWGDVTERAYFDNWRLVQGIEYPSNQVVERNGVLWSSSQALDIVFNAPVDDKDFVIDEKAGALSVKSKGFNFPFNAGQDKQLASGIDLYLGPWNATIVRQSDGIVLLESPISGAFTQGILDEAKKRYPGQPIKAVLSTSDSWPHVGGVRLAVASGLPVYILDLNRPLLDRMIRAPHTLNPDALQRAPRKPNWRIVSSKTEIGSGENRMVLYPLRGASTERQYMVYFPAHRLLYASDTLVLNDDQTLYDPELFREVQQAVDREHLAVDTVYAMHQEPVAWKDMLALLGKSLEPA